MAAPPVVWQRELTTPSMPGSDYSSALAPSRPPAVIDSNEKISDTWRHIKQVAREVSKEFDLLDLLQHTRREETYQFPVQGVSSGRGAGGEGQRWAARGAMQRDTSRWHRQCASHAALPALQAACSLHGHTHKCTHTDARTQPQPPCS